QFPKPVQQPHPPIHFGGESDAALRRVADIGQGWYGFGLEPDATAERVRKLDSMLKRRNRALSDVEISICPYTRETTASDLERYRAAGVDRLIVVCAARDEESLERSLDAMAKTIIAPARAM